MTSCRRLVLLSYLVLLSSALMASKHPRRFPYYDDTKGENYFSLFGFASYISYKPQPGLLTVQFPYTLRSPGFVSVTDTFYASRQDLMGSGKFAYPGIGLELGRGSTTVEASVGAYLKNWSDNIYVGINYRFVLKRFPVRANRYEFASTSFPGENFIRGAADFPVKISVGLFYYQPIWKLGEIPIADNSFSALGYILQGTDSTVATGYGSLGNVTVLYHQNILALTPNFTFGYRPSGGRIDLSFRVSPFILLSEHGGLRFRLENNSLVDWAPRDGFSLNGVIPLHTSGLSAQFNGEPLRQTPFHLKCIMFTLRVGIRIV